MHTLGRNKPGVVHKIGFSFIFGSLKWNIHRHSAFNPRLASGDRFSLFFSKISEKFVAYDLHVSREMSTKLLNRLRLCVPVERLLIKKPPTKQKQTMRQFQRKKMYTFLSLFHRHYYGYCFIARNHWRRKLNWIIEWISKIKNDRPISPSHDNQ